MGLLAAKLAGVKKRIYTRRHSSLHHEYYPQAVKYDKFCNYIASDIIAISNNVENILIKKENVPPNKILLIQHGFDLKAFQNIPQDRIDIIKEKYNLPKNKIFIGAISRYIEWKGISYLINAFYELLVNKKYDIHLILANAKGPDADKIKNTLGKLPNNSYTEISFEKDLFALYQNFDIFVHIPINEQAEAFGQIYIEALAAGIPSVYTLSGIARDFIVHEENAIVVDYKNTEEVIQAVERLLTDQQLTEKLIQNGKEVVQQFSLEKMINKLEVLYNI